MRPVLYRTDFDEKLEWTEDDEFQPPASATDEDDTDGGCVIVGPEGDEE